MSPSLEEPVEEALEHHLREKPNLVAPEPGTPLNIYTMKSD